MTKDYPSLKVGSLIIYLVIFSAASIIDPTH